MVRQIGRNRLGGRWRAERLEVLAGQAEQVRIAVSSYESVSEIRSGEAVIMAVTAADAAAENQARDELAAVYAQRLAQTLGRAQTERSTQYLRQSWLSTQRRQRSCWDCSCTVCMPRYAVGAAIAR